MTREQQLENVLSELMSVVSEQQCVINSMGWNEEGMYYLHWSKAGARKFLYDLTNEVILKAQRVLENDSTEST